MPTVADKSSAVQTMERDWELASALLGGTRAMRLAGAKYLPEWPNEDPMAYRLRCQTAVLFPSYKRTVETLTGKPFSKSLTIGDDVPTRFQPWLEDADLCGRKLHVFAADIFETTLGKGLCGILVDYPKAEGVVTQADETAAGVRPYLIHIKPEQILGWKSEIENGVEELTQLRLMECVTEDDGAFGTKEVKQVRVLYPGKWEIWRKPELKDWDEAFIHEQGTTTLEDIPFVPVYGDRTGFMTSRPPLVELAHMNVEHWQSSSDQQTILHVARVPILSVTGIQDETWEITVGGSSAVKLPIGSTLAYVEHTGKAIDAGRQSIADLEERMRQAGAELLVIQPQRMTAFQVSVENQLGLCVLQRMAQDAEDAIDQALQFMADWVGEPQGGHVTLFDDYAAQNLSEATAQLIGAATVAGKLSDETQFTEYQRRGIISADLTWEEERARLDAQGPALGSLGGVGGPGMPNENAGGGGVA